MLFYKATREVKRAKRAVRIFNINLSLIAFIANFTAEGGTHDIFVFPHLLRILIHSETIKLLDHCAVNLRVVVFNCMRVNKIDIVSHLKYQFVLKNFGVHLRKHQFFLAGKDYLIGN